LIVKDGRVGIVEDASAVSAQVITILDRTRIISRNVYR
jgi:ribosomal protein S28E/S33